MTSITLAEIATQIKALEKRTIANVVEIGRLLHEASEKCEHGTYREWLKTEFSWSHDTARNYRSVYNLAQKTKISSFAKFDVSISALYLIAKMPDGDPTRDTIIKAAQTGRVSYAMASDIIEEAKAKASSDASKIERVTITSGPNSPKVIDIRSRKSPDPPKTVNLHIAQPDVVIKADDEPDYSDPSYAPPSSEERWQGSLANGAGDAVSLWAYWTREFPGWEKFEVPTDLATLAMQAADAWAKIALDLRERSKAATDLAEEKSKTMRH
jgi:hypothetical protein